MNRERKLSKSTIARDLGQKLTQHLVLGCIRDLQRMQSCLLSGDDTNLRSTWEEICVQQQGEESFDWNAYLDLISAFVAARVEALQAYELDALWLLSPQGEDWDCELEEEREPYPVWRGDVIDYLQSEILDKAINWSNARIRKYLEREYDWE
ncbi:hypothetical protein [Stutzerimonas frequens]|uniref:hypothetical protein n=1 Tax=Stutzerimonas frequens TaxID=2968969 RepID=UPI0037491742